MNYQQVTILILNYNGTDHLNSFLPSLIQFTPDEVEIIVADNASIDNSLAILRKFSPRIETIEFSQNHGFAEGYNLAFQSVSRKYVLILNSDVEVTKNWIDPLLSKIESDEKIASVQPAILSYHKKEKYEYAGAAGGYLDVLCYPFCRGRIFDSLETISNHYDNEVEVDWTSGAAMLVNRELFVNLGAFDGSYFAHWEEIDWCIRAKKAGFKLFCVPKSVVYHVGGGTLAYESPKKTYLNFRNSLITILKNYPVNKLVWLFPLRLVLDGIGATKGMKDAGIFYSFAIIKAHFSVYFSFIKIIKSRKLYLSKISQYSSSFQPFTSYSKSIIIQYFIKGISRYRKLPNL